MIFLDMDGVIADFTTAYLELVSSKLTHDDIKDWDIYKYTNQTELEFWMSINEAGEDFYTNIPLYPWSMSLIKELRSKDDVVILTAVSELAPDAAVGKIKWLNKYVKPMIPIIIDSEKYRYASLNTILIDDKPDNIKRFINNGGKALLFKQPWNESETDLPTYEGLFSLSI